MARLLVIGDELIFPLSDRGVRSIAPETSHELSPYRDKEEIQQQLVYLKIIIIKNNNNKLTF